MRKHKDYFRIWLALATIASLLIFSSPTQFARVLAQGTCSLNGTIYRDYNNSGERTVPNEIGVMGIRVTAYNNAGSQVATTTANPDGTYTLSGLDEDTHYRIEFTDIERPLWSGPFGGQSRTTVTFEMCDSTALPVDLGVNNPGQYCQDNPMVATTCYVISHQLDRTEETVVSFPYSTSGSNDITNIPSFDQPPHTNMARAEQVGTTWGLAFHRSTRSLFAAAFQKRHTGYGPSGPGAIYTIRAGQDVTLLTNLPAGANPHPDAGGSPGTDAEWLRDTDSWAAVGKLGLGDMDISDDDTMLYVVNLFNRQLYEITIGLDDPADPTAYDRPPVVTGQSTYDLAGLPSNCPRDDVRPFGSAFRDGRVYVGMVCTAESAVSELWAYVFSMAQGGGGFREELRFPLDYQRRCANRADIPTAECIALYPANWNPWIDDFQTIGPDPGFIPYSTIVYPQPMFVDIEFDNNGDMILGFRDRYADQAGSQTFEPFDLTNDELYLVIPAGEILRACADGSGGWELENNSACGSVASTPGQGNINGPGGGEFYHADNLSIHDELFLGGLAMLPGQSDIAGMYFDPIPTTAALYDAGVRWLSNADGSFQRAYRVYDGEIAPTPGLPLFGKANGVGDLEVMCDPAPLEIGNRVWFDPDVNGIQDPRSGSGARDEVPVGGVTVNLYLPDDLSTPIATTLTSAAGEYYFNESNVPGGLRPFIDYVIRLDNPADYEASGPLFEWELTLTSAGTGPNRTIRDNDSIYENVGVGRFPTIRMTTGSWGENDHTWDFGFTDTTPPTQTPPPGVTVTPPGGGPPGDECEPVLNKTVDQPFAQIGDTVTWTVTLTNPCNIALNGVQVIDTVPPGMTIISVTTSVGTASFSGSTITVNIGTLAPGQTVTITIVTTIDEGANVPFIFDNIASDGTRTATARVVRASQQPATGVTPPVILVLTALGSFLVGMVVVSLRRRRSV